MQDTLKELEPTDSISLMKALEDLGMSTEDWKNYKNGESDPSRNPRYCYEWSFDDGDKVVFNLWHKELKIDDDGTITSEYFPKVRFNIETGTRLGRLKKFHANAEKAATEDVNVKVILLKRKGNADKGQMLRKSDPESWSVSYDSQTESFRFVRGMKSDSDKIDDEIVGYPEGKLRKAFIQQRVRERKYRNKKIKAHKEANGGEVICEVQGCGFNFREVYGDIGADFAEVHHLIPLKDYPKTGAETKLDDLAVVCSNCHRMIHRNGECRKLEELISKSGDQNV